MYAIKQIKICAECRDFANDTFKRIFLNENVRISIKISLKFVPKGPINNYPALVQIMAWRRSGDKPLFEPMMVSLLTHICVTRPQWVNVPVSSEKVITYMDTSEDHDCDVIMSAIASQITCVLIVCSRIYSGTDQRKHQSSASEVFVMGIHRWPMYSPHKGPVTRKMFLFDDVIVCNSIFNDKAVNSIMGIRGSR